MRIQRQGTWITFWWFEFAETMITGRAEVGYFSRSVFKTCGNQQQVPMSLHNL